MSRAWLSFDVETAGFSPRNGFLVEVGVAGFLDGVYVWSGSVLVLPSVKRWWTTPNWYAGAKIHGITVGQLKRHGLPAAEAAAKIHRWIDAWTRDLPDDATIEVVAHHKSFEERWLTEAPWGLKFDACTMKEAKARGLPGKLSDLVEELGVEWKGDPHRAVPDAIASLECRAIYLRRDEAALPLAPVARCSVCGEPQSSTPSGITCPNGHGGAPAVDDCDDIEVDSDDKPERFDDNAGGDPEEDEDGRDGDAPGNPGQGTDRRTGEAPRAEEEGGAGADEGDREDTARSPAAGAGPLAGEGAGHAGGADAARLTPAHLEQLQAETAIDEAGESRGEAEDHLPAATFRALRALARRVPHADLDVQGVWERYHAADSRRRRKPASPRTVARLWQGEVLTPVGPAEISLNGNPGQLFRRPGGEWVALTAGEVARLEVA